MAHVVHMEDYLLPEADAIEDFLPNAEEVQEMQVFNIAPSHGLFSDNPETTAHWMENASQRFN